MPKRYFSIQKPFSIARGPESEFETLAYKFKDDHHSFSFGFVIPKPAH